MHAEDSRKEKIVNYKKHLEENVYPQLFDSLSKNKTVTDTVDNIKKANTTKQAILETSNRT